MSTESDRDLLEKAARAAGIDPILWENGRFLCETMDGTPRYHWNPLTDDGDALRLAVKLNIDFLFDCLGVQSPTVEAIVNVPQEAQPFAIEALDTGDPYAATRRAIVRAAAAMEYAK